MKRKDRSSSSNASEERKSKKSKKTAESGEAQDSSKLDFTSPEKLFSSLLSPTSTEDFFSQYWEKKPLLIQRKDPKYYGSLFAKSDLESLLKKEEILYVQDLNLCRYEGNEKEYLNGEMNTKATTSEVSKQVKENKATIQLHQPQRFKDILWKLISHMESVFGCLVGANVYITPPDSQGLAPHHDDIEAFVLQLEGKKQWKLYKPKSELAQDYSIDLKQEDIGEPTHEIELHEGDLLYFPRGTIHQAATPKGSSGHSTHLTISTYQQSSWGNIMSHILTDAIDKAMETDVEFRRGVPINYFSYMGLGMEGDGKAKNKQEDFVNQVKHLLTRLADFVDAHGTTDKVATDFVYNRLPPYEQKIEAKQDQGESKKQPKVDSEVKFLYPEYVRISVGDADTIPIGVYEAGQDSDDENEEMSEEGEDDEPEDESMEESEEEEKPKKKGKSKKENPKGKKGKQKQKEESEEEEEDSEEETKRKTKKGKVKKEKKEDQAKKTKGKKNKKGKKKDESDEEEEDEEDSSEEEKPQAKKGKAKKDTQKKKAEKGKKGKKKSESDDDEDEDEEEDKSFDIGDQDTEGDSDDEDESDDDDDDDDEGPWVYVHHSLDNIRSSHMMSNQEPSVLKFAISYKDALLHLFRNRHDFIPLKSLPLKEDESLYLITSLWSEGLIRIK